MGQYSFQKKKEKKKKKKETEHFSKYINIKIEMNLCSGKTAKLKDLFPIERETVALMPSFKAKMKYICGTCFMPKNSGR